MSEADDKFCVECQLHLGPFFQCCCNCISQLTDYKHCCVEREERKVRGTCICSEVKGYVCVGFISEGIAHSGWPEHSVGCEMYAPRISQPPQFIGPQICSKL